MRARVIILLILVGCCLGLGGSAKAEAKGLRLIIINTGEVFYKVGDLPQELASDPELAGWALGYKASHLGVLWADVACWNKELVVFKDTTYSDLPAELRERLAVEYPWSRTQRNIWTRFGALIMLGGVLVSPLIKRSHP